MDKRTLGTTLWTIGILLMVFIIATNYIPGLVIVGPMRLVLIAIGGVLAIGGAIIRGRTPRN